MDFWCNFVKMGAACGVSVQIFVPFRVNNLYIFAIMVPI